MENRALHINQCPIVSEHSYNHATAIYVFTNDTRVHCPAFPHCSLFPQPLVQADGHYKITELYVTKENSFVSLSQGMKREQNTRGNAERRYYPLSGLHNAVCVISMLDGFLQLIRQNASSKSHGVL